MIDKRKFEAEVQHLREIASHYDNDTFNQQLKELEGFIQNFNINVLVVGHFNAGKSSLLNKFIGVDDLLLEDDDPTTALATEIYPTDGENYYVGVRSDGSEVDIHPEAKDSLNGFLKAKFFVNSKNLKKYEDFTFVDTPGYDSGIETHNNALKNYISSGSAYVLVMDVQKGSLSSQDIRFLREVSHYSKYVSLIVNKADKSPSSVQSVIECCKNTLDMHGLKVPVFEGSKWADNAADVIPAAVVCFDAQKIFDEALKLRLQIATESFRDMMAVVGKSSDLNTYDLDVKIAEFETAKHFLQGYFETKKTELANAMGERAVERILDDVREAMVLQEDGVIAALMHGSDAAAQAVLIEAIRPTVISSLKEVTALQVKEMLSGIDFNGVLERHAPEDMTNLITGISKNVQEYINAGHLQKIGSSIDAIRKLEKKGSTFKNVASLLAILTDFVNPLLEAVIVFLPDIISLLKAAFGPSEEEKIQDYIRAVIYPQIQMKLHGKLSFVVSEQSEKLVELLQQSVNAQMESIERQLCSVREQKESRSSEFAGLLEKIANDSKVLEHIEKKLEN